MGGDICDDALESARCTPSHTLFHFLRLLPFLLHLLTSHLHLGFVLAVGSRKAGGDEGVRVEKSPYLRRPVGSELEDTTVGLDFIFSLFRGCLL